MLFNSFDFLVFFPIVILIYNIIPKKLEIIWLLISSYYFYMCWNPKYAILIGTSTVVTFASGLLIEKCSDIKKRKIIVGLSLVINLGILIVFKYTSFFLDSVYYVLCLIGLSPASTPRIDLLLPVGISFYTFQAVGYTLDVYRKTVPAEKNIINYALFVSFFPQLVAGPIERSGNLLTQIQNIKKIRRFDLDRIRDGLVLMIWGFFQKLVIADRASILVDQVYNNYSDYGFVELVLASVLFAFQIYCDFSGYTYIARGAARVMGFSLMNNFRQPYLATGIKDFWRRWHISLTSWFTDYVYIPLGGNRKGNIRKYVNILTVFSISGLWHGASWHFVAWGLVHAFYQIIEDILGRLSAKSDCCGSQDRISTKIRKIILTFVFVDMAWVFFAADSIHKAFGIFYQMTTRFKVVSLDNLGLDKTDRTILWVSIALLLVIDILHENHINIMKLINSQEIWFRCFVYLGMIWSVIMFGIYGVGYDASQFIYFQF